MLRKLGISLCCTLALFTSHAYATENHSLQSGVTLEYVLPPNDPQLFSNYTFWPIDANCVINSKDESNVLFIEALAKKGKVNGEKLSKGESLRITVHHGDHLKLSADAGAQVRITNEGEHTVKTTCTA